MRLLVYYRAQVAVSRGTPLRCRNLVAALAKNEAVDLRLVSGDETAEIQKILDVDHRHLTADNLAAQLKVQVKDFKPDVVYGQTHKALRDLIHLVGPDSPKLVADLHGDYAAERLEQYWRPLYKRWLSFFRERVRDRQILPKMDGLTVVGHRLAADVKKFGKPICILWGGVDLEQFQPSLTSDGQPIQVTYAGNYSPYQGVPVLLKAAKMLRERKAPFCFNFIGNIDQFPELRKEIEQDLVGQYSITGQVPYEQVPGLLKEADVLVIPRISDRAAQYGFPSKLPEYMAMGKAIVITDVGEHGQVIENGRTGLIIPPDSPTALAEALLKLQDDGLRHQLGSRARAFAEQELSWQKIGENLYHFLVGLLAE